MQTWRADTAPALRVAPGRARSPAAVCAQGTRCSRTCGGQRGPAGGAAPACPRPAQDKPETATSARPWGRGRACSSGFAAQSGSPSGAAAAGSGGRANRAPAVLRRGYLPIMFRASTTSARLRPSNAWNRLGRFRSPRRKLATGGGYNIEALTDRTGSVIERYEYTPYGKPTVYTGAGTDGKWFTADDVSATVSAKGNNVLFQGRELDGESGNFQFRNRYYSATLGRFVSRDKYRFDADDMNLLRFVMNSPLMLRDSSGNSTVGFVSPCDAYPKGSSCSLPCSDKDGSAKVNDTYTDRAKSICNQFVVMYQMSPRVKAAASCLANAERQCQHLSSCKDRNNCRLKAHFDCYMKTKFINDALERLTWTNPFPDEGWEIGLTELLPDRLGLERKTKCCQK
jgi:RHS repeat-associated protein